MKEAFEVLNKYEINGIFGWSSFVYDRINKIKKNRMSAALEYTLNNKKIKEESETLKQAIERYINEKEELFKNNLKCFDEDKITEINSLKKELDNTLDKYMDELLYQYVTEITNKTSTVNIVHTWRKELTEVNKAMNTIIDKTIDGMSSEERLQLYLDVVNASDTKHTYQYRILSNKNVKDKYLCIVDTDSKVSSTRRILAHFLENKGYSGLTNSTVYLDNHVGDGLDLAGLAIDNLKGNQILVLSKNEKINELKKISISDSFTKNLIKSVVDNGGFREKGQYFWYSEPQKIMLNKLYEKAEEMNKPKPQSSFMSAFAKYKEEQNANKTKKVVKTENPTSGGEGR